MLKFEYDENKKTFESNGKCLSSNALPEQTEVWAGRLSDGNWAVLLLNRASFEAEVEIKWNELFLSVNRAYVRDLWEHKDLGGFNNSYKVNLSSHESQFLKVFEQDPLNDGTDGLTLWILIGVLALLLGFLGFVVVYINYKRKKEEIKKIDISEENIDQNLVRETKDSDAV